MGQLNKQFGLVLISFDQFKVILKVFHKAILINCMGLLFFTFSITVIKSGGYF
jgi:hypothetical protein